MLSPWWQTCLHFVDLCDPLLCCWILNVSNHGLHMILKYIPVIFILLNAKVTMHFFNIMDIIISAEMGLL